MKKAVNKKLCIGIALVICFAIFAGILFSVKLTTASPSSAVFDEETIQKQLEMARNTTVVPDKTK